MAVRYAVATGNWSATSTWDGTTTLPASGDTVVANGFTVTIDQDVTVVEIRTLASGSGASGGGFTISSARTINANVLAGTTTCLTCTNTSGVTVTINGTVTGSAATITTHGVSLTGTGTLAVVGNIAAGTAQSSAGLNVSAAATVTVTGNVTGSSGGNSVNGAGVQSSAASTITITGNVSGGLSGGASPGVGNNGAGSVTIVGSVTGAGGGVSGHGVHNSSAGSVTVTGAVTSIMAGSTGSHGINNISTGAVSATGTITGGSGVGSSASYGINNTSTGNLAVKGDIVAGATLGSVGVSNTSTGQLHHEGDVVGVATGSPAGTAGLASRVTAIYSSVSRKHGYAEASTAMPTTPTNLSGALNYLYGVGNPSGQSGQAAVADVRKSTVYGPTSNLTGLAYIPGASSVLAGVNVDQTVGSATIAAADIRAALGMASANLDTQIAAVQTDTTNLKTRVPAALTANGNIKSSLVEIITTALTETTGLLAAGFKKFFNVATPTGTVNSLPDAVPDASGGLPVTGNRLTAIPTVAAVTTVANLTNAPSSGDFTATMKTSLNAATPASVVGAVGSVAGNVGGNVVGSVGSVASFGALVADIATAVWSAVTRVLTAGTNIVLAKGTGVTGFNDIAAGAAMTLTGAYDAAKTAAQASDIPSATIATGAAAAVSAATDASTLVNRLTAIRAAKLDNLPEGVKKNTALLNVEFFMADASDHVSGKTGLTVTAVRSIDGVAPAPCANSPAEVGNGLYKIDLAAADLNGDIITFIFSATGADPFPMMVKTSA